MVLELDAKMYVKMAKIHLRQKFYNFRTDKKICMRI